MVRKILKKKKIKKLFLSNKKAELFKKYKSNLNKKLTRKSKKIKKINAVKNRRKMATQKYELKKLKEFLRVLDKSFLRSLRRVKKAERISLVKYLILSKLKEIHLNLVNKFSEKVIDYRKEGSNYIYVRHKLHQFPHKLKIFEGDFTKEEFKKIMNYLSLLKREIKNV